MFDEMIVAFSDLINNAILLFGLGFIYAATNIDQKSTKIIRKILFGLVIGMITVLIMYNPWVFEQGIIFDTRSVIMGVTGLFFGYVTAGVAMIAPIVYRIIIGGGGVYAGVSTIIVTTLIGLFWHKLRLKLPRMKPIWEYLVFGLVIHIATLLCFFLIPNPLDVIKNTFIPYLTLFPVITMTLAQIIHNQKDRLESHQKLLDQQILLQASIDSNPSMEVYAVDTNYMYLAFNAFHQLSMKKHYRQDIRIGASFIGYLSILQISKRIKESLDRALKGESFTTVTNMEDNIERFFEEQYAPIVDHDGKIIGVTVFSRDITEQKKYEASLLYFSYHDQLTGLYNRNYIRNELDVLDHEDYYPLSIIMLDVNGLKIINDAYGHEVGDDMIIKISGELKKVFSVNARIARMGGDEFLILLPNINEKDVKVLIDIAKRKIEKIQFQEIKASVSFGSCTKNDASLAKNELLKFAEDDMYSHKLFEVNSHRNETIKTILNTLREKNPREEKHSARVSRICHDIGKRLKLSDDELKMLTMISNLHDIGKIAIDEGILNKPGKLDDREWEIIKRHPEIGYRMLSASPEYATIAIDILSHHERYDGKGYPRQLSGEDIPLRARIISLADAYDAMVSERPYRKPLSHEEAIDEIKRNLGKQFDPQLGQIFLDLYQSKGVQL